MVFSDNTIVTDIVSVAQIEISNDADAITILIDSSAIENNHATNVTPHIGVIDSTFSNNKGRLWKMEFESVIFNNKEINGNNHSYLMEFENTRVLLESIQFMGNLCVSSWNVSDIQTDKFNGECIVFEDTAAHFMVQILHVWCLYNFSITNSRNSYKFSIFKFEIWLCIIYSEYIGCEWHWRYDSCRYW